MIRSTRLSIWTTSSGEWEVEVVAHSASSTFTVQTEIVQLLAGIEQKFYNLRRAFSGVSSGDNTTLERYHEDIANFGNQFYQNIFRQIDRKFWQTILREGGRYSFDLDPKLWNKCWELLYDEDIGFLDGGGTRPIVRQIGKVHNPSEMLFLYPPQMLFLGTDPFDRPTRESEQYDAVIRSAPPGYKKIIVKIGADSSHSDSQWDEFVSCLWKNKPNILHIVAHGFGSQALVFNDNNSSVGGRITYSGLVNVLAEVNSVNLLILTACKSGHFFSRYPQLAQLLFDKTNLAAVVLMASEIGASAVTKFTYYFYQALWRGEDVASAIGYARNQMRLQISQNFSLQWSTPMLYERTAVNPFGKWIEEMRKTYLNDPIIQDEHVEALHEAATDLQERVDDLVAVQQQADPFQSELIFHCGEIERSVRRFSNALTLTNRSYEPQNAAWLNSVKATKSQAVPTLQRLVAFSKNPKRKHELPLVTEEALSVCRDLLEHFSLPNLPKSYL